MGIPENDSLRKALFVYLFSLTVSHSASRVDWRMFLCVNGKC